MRIHFSGLSKQELARRETLFHVANGYLGMRASFEEGVPTELRSVRGTYINGYYDSAPIHYEERLYGFAQTQQSIVNIIDVQGMDILLDGERFSCFEGTLDNFEQQLDMRRGVYTRDITWTSPKGKQSRLVFSRLASFELQQLLLMQVAVTPLNWSGTIRIASSQHGDVVQDYDLNDPRKASVGKKMIDVKEAVIVDDLMLMTAKTTQSKLIMASAVAHQSLAELQRGYTAKGEVNEAVFSGQIKENEPLTLSKYCVFTDERRFAQPREAALKLIVQARETDFEGWVKKQEDFLRAFWRHAGASVTGDEALNASLTWSMYTLLASAGRDGIGNIASKGLSGEGYEGHYFWDTEIYMFPFFLLTNKDIALQLLKSRAAMLPAAKAHAREMGHQTGALYAWRTITGSECSAYFPSGSAQYHINGAVARAFLTYYQVTGDLAFMAKTGAEILIETARLWMDAGHSHKGQFRIDSVTGPDEYSCVVNNNYYTNRSAQDHLKGLVKLCADLQEQGLLDQVIEKTGLAQVELDAFWKAATSMYLPFDEELGISAQDDAFLTKARMNLANIPKDKFPLLLHFHPLYLYRLQVCKQADTVLAHFLYEEGEPEEVIRKTYDYYEEITTHDSSLSECMFSMMAARTGQVEKAFSYYRASAVLDLEDTHGNTADGIHAANMGGCWMGIVFGFGGLRLHQDGLVFRPCLPDELKGYAFSITYQGNLIKVRVDSQAARFELLEGQGLNITVFNQQHMLKDTLSVPLNG
ncbi:MAG: glycoside hydrolase family 65 protein [Clostridiales bacterium]|nr:glycoside hydrolase family 65 protein [Clostridiales bacterium]